MDTISHYSIHECPSPLATKQVMGIQFGMDTAIKSAENMARANPGKTYYVMKAVASVKAETPVTITNLQGTTTICAEINGEPNGIRQ